MAGGLLACLLCAKHYAAQCHALMTAGSKLLHIMLAEDSTITTTTATGLSWSLVMLS
jgi:hypothetical protein